MGKLQLFTHCILLITIPTLFACPENNSPQVKFQSVNYEYQKEWGHPNTYDDIIHLLENLESGELERTYSPMQLEKVNDYLVILAKKGILPNEFEKEMSVEEDTYELMYGEDNAFQLTRYLENSSEYMIVPAVLNGYSGYDIAQCGKIGKSWKKTKNFAKKHKKAIIIGAVVVVAVTVVAVAVVAASSASAASAVAGASGAAAGAGIRASDSGHSESKKSEPKEEAPPVSAAPKETMPPVDTNEAPAMKAALDEHVASFKEFLMEDKTAQQATRSKGWDDMAFGEKAREMGANIAHKALDEVTDLVKAVPQLCEEVKELGAKFLPEHLKLPNSGNTGNPIENYENLVIKGHKAIDTVFSTDQSEFFTAEAVENDFMNNFTIGVLPPPGAVFKVFSDTSKFARAGKAFDRAGYTKAGRGLIKHGYRENSVFPKPFGNPSQINAHGQRVLESILNHPERMIYERPHPDFGKVIEIVIPEKWGARFTIEGEMIGFLEP